MKAVKFDLCGVRFTIERRTEAVLRERLRPAHGYLRAFTGASGYNLAYHVLDGRELDTSTDIPRDLGDWGRCLKVYGASPRHLRRKMLPILKDWARQLREKGYDAEIS